MSAAEVTSIDSAAKRYHELRTYREWLEGISKLEIRRAQVQESHALDQLQKARKNHTGERTYMNACTLDVCSNGPGLSLAEFSWLKNTRAERNKTARKNEMAKFGEVPSNPFRVARSTKYAPLPIPGPERPPWWLVLLLVAVFGGCGWSFYQALCMVAP